MDETYPEPISDPAAEGIPEYADDDSTAWDDVPSPRAADGRDPAPLPPDRDSGPVALDEYGTTAEEQRRGESLDQRLSREEPDLTPDAVRIEPDPELAEEATGQGAAGQLAEDTLVGEGPVDPHLESAVSMYDRDEPGVPGDRPVGRLVAPDEGSHTDTEPDEVGLDVGASGGGASAEELAVREQRYGPPAR